MLDTYNDHNFNSNSNTNDYNREDDYTDQELLENEISRLNAKLALIKKLVSEIETIEKLPLFRIEGVDEEALSRYILAKSRLYYKIKF
jgi:hypothetical protein